METLEKRELLSGDTPRIIAVKPVDGSTLPVGVAHPQLQISFSEDMVASEAQDTANYKLVGSKGNVITIDSAVYTSNPFTNTFTVDISYNSGNNLIADTYSLFVIGDHIHDTDDGRPLAQTGQIVVANTGQNNVASVISPTDGALRSLGNYPVPPVQTTNANPWATALADVNGDGFKDLIVATSRTNQLVIYLGQKDGGFGLNPSLRLSLGGRLAGTDAKSIVVADFNEDGLPDVAVANANARSGNNNAIQGISVFLNTTQFGTLSFASVANYATGDGPVGLVAADFDGDGHLDLATADSIADSGGSFNVSVLLGDGAGNFGAPKFIKVGDQGAVLKNPTDLAGGLINTDGRPDLAVSGTDVITGKAAAVILLNTSSPGAPSFSRTEVVVPSTSSASVFTSIDVGVLRTTNNSGATADVVATTGANTLAVMRNTGTGTFGSPVEIALAPFGITTPTGVTIQDLDGDNLNDVALVNDATAGGLAVLHNIGGGGAIALDTPTVYGVGARPKSLAFGDVQNDGKLDVVTANSTEQDVSLIYGSGTFNTSQSPAGIFMPAILTPNVDAPGEMAVGDFNNDGLPDVVVTNPNSSTVSVLLSTGPGTFAAPVTYTTIFNDPVFGLVGQEPISVAVGDLTGTGKVDIVVASGVSPDGFNGFVTVLANDGTGNFGAGPVADVTVGVTPTKVALADFDEDGLPDLAVSFNSIIGGGVSVRLDTSDPVTGQRSFAGRIELAQGAFATTLAVGDLNADGHQDIIVADSPFVAGLPGDVIYLRGNGDGSFKEPTRDDAGDNVTSITLSDVNRDGFLDIVAVTSPDDPTLPNPSHVSVLLNAFGVDFHLSQFIPLPDDTRYQNAFGAPPNANVIATTINDDVFPDLIISVAVPSTDPLSPSNFDNVFTMLGNGDGTFAAPVPYLAADADLSTVAAPSFLALVSDPLVRATTFTVSSGLVQNDLITNGDFEDENLSGSTVPGVDRERGTLQGWSTFDVDNSRGRWSIQIGRRTGSDPNRTWSPISMVQTIGFNQGSFRAMLDQPDLRPINMFDVGTPIDGGLNPQPPYPNSAFINPNPADSFNGTHVLYQDVTIPVNATIATLKFDLYLNNQMASELDNVLGTGWYGPDRAGGVNSLDYRVLAANQQVRVDIVDPTADLLDTGAGVLLNLFKTTKRDNPIENFVALSFNLLPFAGKTIRFRVAAVNNKGKLVVGVDNVSLVTRFIDTQAPQFLRLDLRNPGFNASSTLAGQTTDPTFVGQVTDNGGVDNIRFVQFDINNNGFDSQDPVADPQNAQGARHDADFDSLGNFQKTLTQFGGMLPGLYHIPIRVVDKAGNETVLFRDFFWQGLSNKQWQALGPGASDVRDLPGQGPEDFKSVSGRVSSIVVDPRDQSGNTIYLGAANGGIWKTIDGGANWRPLTDYQTDRNGNPVALAIASLAISKTNPDTLYAATGIADHSVDSRPGIGVLKTTDGGRTWTLLADQLTDPLGNPLTNLRGARVTKIAVDQNTPNRAYVAVASGGSAGTGLYKTEDGGQTWTDVLNPANMFLPNGQALGAGMLLPSVTDVLIDPFNADDIFVGIGDMGMPGVSGNQQAMGVWKSANRGNSWKLIVGGNDPLVQNAYLPSGAGAGKPGAPAGIPLGRITLGEGNGRPGDEQFLYVMIANPPPGPNAVTVNGEPDFGTFMGLWKSKDGALNWTHVQIQQDIARGNATNYVPINLFGHDGSEVGAMYVDPNNPNVVYLGGSRRFDYADHDVTNSAGNQLDHEFIRVETGDMRDTTFTSARFGLINDGQDITIAEEVENPGDDNKAVHQNEGVYWYDLEKKTINGYLTDFQFNLLTLDQSQHRLPLGIHALTFDGQGRLLVGTNGGIWRGINRGFGFDTASTRRFDYPPGYTSGELEFDDANEPFFETWETIPYGMDFTDLNSNLQIAALTSVDIDPRNVNRYVVATARNGFAGVDPRIGITGLPINRWLTMDIYGPTDRIDSIGNLETQDGGFVYFGGIDPKAPPNTPEKLFRNYQHEHFRGIRVESSQRDGLAGSWTLDQSAGISITDGVTRLFPLVKNPNKVFESGRFTDELALGTDRVYNTRTSSNQWNDEVGHALSSKGGLITALAFATNSSPGASDLPSDGGWYAGTDLGEVFVDLHNGADGWPERDAGLPNARINGIAVDPNDATHHTAYVMFDTNPSGGQVFKTTDGGVTWTPVNNGLPNVAAYHMVIDPRAATGAGGGRLFLGTEVGVFMSPDGGQSWQRLGQGLPNVPVTNMTLNTNTNTLVAATLGRGAFKISVDVFGPQVTSINPGPAPATVNLPGPPVVVVPAGTGPVNVPVNPPMTQATVIFNEPVLSSTFTVDASRLARTQFAGALASGVDYWNNLVRNDFNKYLRRGPNSTELANFVNKLKANQIEAENVIASLVGGFNLNEYFSKRAGNNSTNWINGIFNDILGRNPTAAEVASNLFQLSHGSSRVTIALNIMSGDEYRTNLINGYFLQLVKRLPTATELSDLLSKFPTGSVSPTGFTDESALKTIASTMEYYQKFGTTTALAPQFASATVGYGDFNGDGLLDKAVVDTAHDRIILYSGLPALQGGGFSTSAAKNLQLPFGSTPRAVLVTDLNGDNHPDILVADAGRNNVTVFLNTRPASPPTFSFGAGVAYNAGPNPVALAAADLDGDGKLDLVVANNGPDAAGNYVVSVIAGTGPGRFGAVSSFVVGDTSPSGLTRPNGLVLADVNGDTKLDIAVSGVEGYRVLTNGSTPGSFFFTPQTVETNSVPSAVALVDVNGDGIPDLITADLGNDTVSIRNGQVGGGFSKAATTLFLPTGAGARSMVVTDLNGDGKPDIVVGDSLTDAVTVFLNQQTTPGVVRFGAGTTFSAGTSPIGIVAADFNGDGHLDLAVADAAADAGGKFDVSLLLGDGTGNFSPAIAVDTGLTQALTGLAQGNLNGDASPDLVVSSSAGLNALINDGLLFATTVPQSLSNIPTTSVAIGQIDTDATNDVAATTTSGLLLVFQNDGQSTPTFSGPTIFQAGSTFAATGVTIRDLNGDGRNDILVVNGVSAGTVTVLKNTTVQSTSGPDTVTFTSPVSYSVGDSPSSLAVADTNQDLPLDVVTVNAGSDDATTLLGFPDGTFRTPTDQGLISQAYLDIINRLPTATEMAAQVQSLGQMEQARLVGPRGQTVPFDIQGIDRDPRTHFDDFSVYTLTFAPQVADGSYSLVVGPTTLGNNITDLFNNAMNQNGTPPNGEFPGDRFVGPLAINTSDNGQFVTGLFHDLIQRPADTPTFLNLLNSVDAARNAALTPTAMQFLNRSGLITGASNASPIVITSTAHGLRTGDQVIITGVTGNIAANGTFTVTVIDVNKFSLDGSTGNGKYTGGGTWTATKTFEYRQQLVKSFYNLYLGRSPNPTELNNWVTNHFAKGGKDERMQARLLADRDTAGKPLAIREYFNRSQALNPTDPYGNTNPTARWLTQVFKDVLGRIPKKSEITNGLNQLTLMTKEAYVFTLLTGAEYRNRLVTGYFRKFFGRIPTASEVSTWTALLQNGQTDEQVIGGLLGQPEYFQYKGNTNPAWLTSLYRVLLGRDPQPSELATDFAALLKTFQQQRQGAANVISTGKEFTTNLIIKDFNKFLGRAPSTDPTNPVLGDEVSFWLSRFNQGLSDEAFIAKLVANYNNSEYFFGPKGSGNDRQWVDSIYLDILGRARDAVTETTLLNALNNGTLSREQVALTLLTTGVASEQSANEYRTDLIFSGFNTYLGRDPTQPPTPNDELTFWLKQFSQGITDEQFFASLLATQEHYVRPHLFP